MTSRLSERLAQLYYRQFMGAQMNYISITGLVLDLIGVIMLGYDLVRVQRKLREDASDRLDTLMEVADSAGGLDKFLKSISGDFREYERDEGRYVPRQGTFDYESAKQSLDELKDSINGLADNLHAVATMMVAGVENDQATAGLSLKVTYGGLLFILIGFGLQICGYLPPELITGLWSNI